MEYSGQIAKQESRATIFVYWASNLQNYGAVDFDDNSQSISTEEKLAIIPDLTMQLWICIFMIIRLVDMAQRLKALAHG